MKPKPWVAQQLKVVVDIQQVEKTTQGWGESGARCLKVGLKFSPSSEYQHATASTVRHAGPAVDEIGRGIEGKDITVRRRFLGGRLSGLLKETGADCLAWAKSSPLG
jgi:hypothetical protein